jgi:signal transduction histidine kinase
MNVRQHDSTVNPHARDSQDILLPAAEHRNEAFHAWPERQALEARFRLAVEASGTVVFEQDTALQYTRVYNPHPPFTVERVLGKVDEDLFTPEDAACITRLKRRALDDGVAGRADFKITLGRELLYYDLRVEPLFDENGTAIGIASAATEITSRIVSSPTTWEAIFAAEQAAVAGERNRIARDLHDSVTQALFTISLISEALPDAWHNHREEAMQNLANLNHLAKGALAEMRAMLLELRSSEPADRNLDEMLRQLPNRIADHTTPPVTTTVIGDAPLPKSVQVAFYRIAQEALNNVYKHAKASRASIHLHFRPDGSVMLRIIDDGNGIDPGDGHNHQLGLGIMRERAQEIGAGLTIESQPGQGTQVVAVWHASQQDQNHGQ